MKTALVAADGTVRVVDQPALKMLPGSVRVKVTRSLISTGTEASVIRARREAPAEGDLRPGYSAVGTVVEVSADCGKAEAGQRVACAGWAVATHSQEVVVPRNLFVPIPDAVDDDNAAFIGLAVTCMHSLRQGGLAGGESVAVIGMGLFGQIVARIARAFGAVVCGVAKYPHQAEHAAGACDKVYPAGGMAEAIAALTPEDLVDVAVVAAGGELTEMIQVAGKLLRDRGTLVIIGRGAARIDFTQAMFAKELTLKNTRAYGPGRYDPQYEREGIDYPLGYVRWTENRNMAGVLDLMARGLLDLRGLITTRCRLEDIPAAYEKLMVAGNREIAAIVEHD